MKRIGLLLIVAGLVFLMSACSTSKADKNEPDQTARSQEMTANKDEAGLANEENEAGSTTGAEEERSRNNSSNDDLNEGTEKQTDNSSKDSSKTDESTESAQASSSAAKEESSTNESEINNSDSGPLTKKEAEQLVRKHLQLANRPEIKVQYDHDENGRYVIHVYEVVDQGEFSHTATWGWYYVNPETQQIEEMI